MNQKTSISTSADPVFIATAHQEFVEAAFDELKRFEKKLSYGELLAPGILLCTLPRDNHPLDLTLFLRQVIQQRPIFVRHLAPVQAVIHLSNTENDIGDLALAIANLPTFTVLERGQRFAVQTRLLQTDTVTERAGSNKRAYSSCLLYTYPSPRD